MKISIIGSHGTGKTTLAQGVSGDKYKSIDGPARCVRRCSKELGLSLLQEQFLINEAMLFMWSNNKPLDNVIYTRSPLDCIAYNRAFSYDEVYDLDKYIGRVKEEIGTLKDDVLWVYLPIEFELEDDGVRFTDKDFQKRVDEEMVKLLKEFEINYVVITGSIEKRIEKLKAIINED